MPQEQMNRDINYSRISGGFSSRRAEGKLPSKLPSPLFLNLGCGNDVREGFLNIDLFNDNPSVIYGDIRKLELPDNCADILLASDILEHFSHREIDAVLTEWNRVLKPGGEIIIRCPSLYLQVKAYTEKKWDADIASYMIFGGQTNPGDYHSVAFDSESITKHLHNTGFENVEVTEHDTPQDRGYINLNMTAKAKKKKVIQPSLTLSESNQKDDFGAFSFTAEEEDKKPFESTVDMSDYIHFGSAPENAKINLIWEGSQFVYHSLALINREICSKILDSGQLNLTIIPYEKEQFDPAQNDKYMKLCVNDVRFKPDAPDSVKKLPYCWVRHQWPPKGEVPNGAKWIIMQPWEFTTHRKDFAEIFKQADEVWTPSNYSRQSFINSGLEFNKVQVIPNGIDPQLFTPVGEKYPLETNKKFKLLFVGGTIFRKGIDVLIKAYLNEFTAKDDISLVIKDMGGSSFYKNMNFKDTILDIQNNPESPEIIYLDSNLTEEEMASLYRACNLFVSPYRGEGFSLPTLEAMACGLPVMVTKGGATDDFVDTQVGWLIDSEPRLLGEVIDKSELTGPAYVLEPDEESLRLTLKHIFRNPWELWFTGLLASARARGKWNWKRPALKVLSRLDVLYGTQMAAEAERLIPEFEDIALIAGKAEEAFFQSDFDEALIYFHKAYLSNSLPDKIRNHCLNRIIQIYLDSGQTDNAAQYIERAMGSISDNPEMYYHLARLQAINGQWVEALESVTQLLDTWHQNRFNMTLGVSHDSILVFTADLLFNTGEIEGAVQLYTEALKMNSENADACYGAGMCFRDGGADSEAREMFEWTLRINPNYREASMELENLTNA